MEFLVVFFFVTIGIRIAYPSVRLEAFIFVFRLIVVESLLFSSSALENDLQKHREGIVIF